MKRLLLFSAAAVVLTVASPVFAGTITLDFGSGSLASTATDTQIQSYIRGLLPSGDSVVVAAAAGSCNNTDTCPYNADGHVVGPSGTSYTLATKDGGAFIGTGGDFNTTPAGANAINDV
jgi:hypothetical protein